MKVLNYAARKIIVNMADHFPAYCLRILYVCVCSWIYRHFDDITIIFVIIKEAGVNYN